MPNSSEAVSGILGLIHSVSVSDETENELTRTKQILTHERPRAELVISILHRPIRLWERDLTNLDIVPHATEEHTINLELTISQVCHYTASPNRGDILACCTAKRKRR